MGTLETDYLVVGAGASGMAFTDTLIAESDADVVMVDRRPGPGGHWNDAYPFVRLHQPSAYYGVNSRRLGNDTIDEVGPNAGFYERATGAEICDYYRRVLDEQLIGSGQVRFFGMCDYIGRNGGRHRFVSRLTGETTDVQVRRRVVDATYLESSIPATHTPPFEVAPDLRLVTPNELVDLTNPGEGFTVIGAGKTSMDTCSWLLDHDVPPEDIRWIRPRDPWTLDRRYMQPLEQLPRFMEGLSLQLEAAAQAEDVPDLFRRLEASGQLVRLDPEVEPETYRGAILSQDERDNLRQIRHVIRQGRVLRLDSDRIVLDEGTVPTDQQQMHVDCTATGLNPAPERPIFDHNRITVQAIQFGITPLSAAITGYIEATRDDDAEKNRLCPPNAASSDAVDWIRTTYITRRAYAAWRDESDIHDWLQRSRLNIARGIGDHRDDPRMKAALDRLAAQNEPAIANLDRLLEPTASSTI